MNTVTQLAKDIALIGGFFASASLSGREKVIAEIAARWIVNAADGIEKLIEQGVDIKDLRVESPEARLEEYLAKIRETKA